MADAELIVDLARADAVAGPWDALAVERGLPMSSPAWMLGWWRHFAPLSAELRIVVVRERGNVIGLVPLFVDPGRRATARLYRLLAYDFASVLSPLARSDREWEVAAATAELLAEPELCPERLELGPIPLSSSWATALRERWPGKLRPLAPRRLETTAIVDIRDRSFEQWLADRGGRFRHNLLRRRRQFERAEGTYRFADARSMATDVRTFTDLHARRWRDHGSSRLVPHGDRVPAFLGEVAEALPAPARLRLLVLELEGQPICANLFMAGGGEVITFNQGWDERHRRLSPTLLAMLHTIEDACARDERRLDLGWGGNPYKQPFADGIDAVTWNTLLPPGRQLARALPRALPAIARWRARETVKRVLPERELARLRDLRAYTIRPPGGSSRPRRSLTSSAWMIQRGSSGARAADRCRE